MTRRLQFTHDSRTFSAAERQMGGKEGEAGPPGPPGQLGQDSRGGKTGEVASRGADPVIEWKVDMDGETVLEFRGEFPYKDEDVRKRIVEWYEIQKRRPGTAPNVRSGDRS